jgi:hypothetical protein
METEVSLSLGGTHRNFPDFQAAYEQRYAAKYGRFRLPQEKSVLEIAPCRQPAATSLTEP